MPIDLKDLTIEQARTVASWFNGNPIPTEPSPAPAQYSRVEGDGRPVIVRSRDAGCIYGKLDYYTATEVRLKDARQMWSWAAAEGGSLMDCAVHGVKGGKFSAPAPFATVFGQCTIIDVTPKARPSLEAAKW